MSEAKKWPQYLAAVCICIGAWGTGTVIGWTGTITEELKKGNLNGLKMSYDELDWTGSLMTLGAMVTCFPVGYLSDKIGRKPTVLITVIPFTLGWACIVFAQNVVMVYIGRLLTGLAGGAFCVSAPLYTGEIAETEIRGRLGTFFQLFITIGIMFAFTGGALLPVKLFTGFCGVIPIVFAITMLFQPETPLYDMRAGKMEAAQKTMKRLRGSEYDSAPEMKLLQEQINKDAEHEGSFWTTLKTKPAIKANIICFSLMFYQQFCGINAFIFYLDDIFQSSESTLNSNTCSMIVGAVQVVSTLFAAYFIEKFGRKILLIASDSLMSLATFMLGFFFMLKSRELVDKSTLQTLDFLPVLSLIIFIIAFSIGFGPIPWLASSELFTPEIRALCSSAAATFNWFLAFLVTCFFFPVSSTLGLDITFYIFGAISLSGVFFVWLVMPETKGKSIQEIQTELGGD